MTEEEGLAIRRAQIKRLEAEAAERDASGFVICGMTDNVLLLPYGTPPTPVVLPGEWIYLYGEEATDHWNTKANAWFDAHPVVDETPGRK